MHHVYGVCAYCKRRTNVGVGIDKENQKQTLACSKHTFKHTPIEMPAPQRPAQQRGASI